MSKTNIYSRLTALFSSTQNATKTSIKPFKPKPKPIIPTTSLDPTHLIALDPQINDLLAEQDSQLLFEKFNHLSQFTYFRDTGRVAYKLTFRRLALSNDYPLIQKLLESQEKFITNEGFAARIIHLYGKYGMFDHAHKVFDELPNRNVKQTNNHFCVLLEAAASSGKYDKVLEMFRELPEKLSVKRSSNCYNTVIRVLCDRGSVDDAVLLLDEMESEGVKPDNVSFNMLLRVYYEAGDCKKGDKLWERMITSNVAPITQTYCSKLRGLSKDEKLREALELALQLEDKGVKLDLCTYNVMIDGLIKNGDFVGVKEWCGKLIKSGCKPNKTTLYTLVPFLCEKGDYELAFEVCENVLKGRHCSINEPALQNVVDGLAKNSMTDKAKILIEQGLSNTYSPCHLVMPESV